MAETESFDVFLPFLLSFTVPEVSMMMAIICLVLNIIIPGLGTLIAAVLKKEGRYFVFFAVTAAIQFVGTIIVVGYIYSVAFGVCMVIWPEGKADKRPKRMWPASGAPAEVLEEARKKKEEKGAKSEEKPEKKPEKKPEEKKEAPEKASEKPEAPDSPEAPDAPESPESPIEDAAEIVSEQASKAIEEQASFEPPEGADAGETVDTPETAGSAGAAGEEGVYEAVM